MADYGNVIKFAYDVWVWLCQKIKICFAFIWNAPLHPRTVGLRGAGDYGNVIKFAYDVWVWVCDVGVSED